MCVDRAGEFVDELSQLGKECPCGINFSTNEVSDKEKEEALLAYCPSYTVTQPGHLENILHRITHPELLHIICRCLSYRNHCFFFRTAVKTFHVTHCYLASNRRLIFWNRL